MSENVAAGIREILNFKCAIGNRKGMVGGEQGIEGG
jgi:hypothetical protein